MAIIGLDSPYRQRPSGLGPIPRVPPQPPPSPPRTPPPPPAPGFNEEELRKAWLAYGKYTPADLKAFLAARPDIATGVEIVGSHGGNIRLPNRRLIDVIIGAGLGGTGAWWNPIDETTGAPPPAVSAPALSSYEAQFDDPSTKLLEQYLLYNLGRLQETPYTGREAEVLRTRALEPIEQDRQAARQRALARISQAGYLPTSGVAQELLNQLETGYDVSRAQSQNQLAYQQIAEERAREQEALSLVSLLQQLPTMAQQQALAAVGLAPSPESMVNQLLQLYQIGQQQRQQNLAFWQGLLQMAPFLARTFPGGTQPGGIPSTINPFPSY